MTSTNQPLTTTLITITPDMARNLVETLPYEFQRSVRKYHVDDLAEEMRRGTFLHATTIRVMVIKPNPDSPDRQYVIDGQHRLRAVISSGIPQLFNLITERVADYKIIARTYGALDRGLRRTIGDGLRPLKLDEEFGINASDVTHLSVAVSFLSSRCITTKGADRKVHSDDRVRWMRLYARYMQEYTTIISGSTSHIRNSAVRSATLAVALLTLRFTAPLAEKQGNPSVSEFWSGAVFDDSVSIGDPRKLVNRHLLMVGIQGGNRTSGVAGDYVPASYAARYIAACFNAYMARETRKMAKVIDSEAPLVLYGVPRDTTEWMQ